MPQPEEQCRNFVRVSRTSLGIPKRTEREDWKGRWGEERERVGDSRSIECSTELRESTGSLSHSADNHSRPLPIYSLLSPHSPPTPTRGYCVHNSGDGLRIPLSIADNNLIELATLTYLSSPPPLHV